MSDAYAMPRPFSGPQWSRGHDHEGRPGRQSRVDGREEFSEGRRSGRPERSERASRSEPRAERSDVRTRGRQGRREAWLAMMGAEGGVEDFANEGRGRGRRGDGRGRGRGYGGSPFGGPNFGGGRGRARRGDVRAAILALLAEEPRNGYGMIQEIEERSGGVWKPSPGAVYPALQQLEDEGLIASVEVDGRKLFELTAAGREYVTANAQQVNEPWEAVAAAAGTGMRDSKHQIAQLWHAMVAVQRDGTPEQIKAASTILSDARKSLYRILAEDEGPAS